MRTKCVNCVNNLTQFTHILCVFTQNLRRIYAEFTHMNLANFIYACYGLRIYACFIDLRILRIFTHVSLTY